MDLAEDFMKRAKELKRDGQNNKGNPNRKKMDSQAGLVPSHVRAKLTAYPARGQTRAAGQSLTSTSSRCLDVRQATSSTFKGIKVGQVLKSRRYSNEPHDLSAAWAKRPP